MEKNEEGAAGCPNGVPGMYRKNKPSEDRLIFNALQKCQPCTRRRLSEITGLEIATLCRALYNLTYKTEQVVVSNYGRCPKTKKTVMHFTLKAKEPAN